MATDKLAVDEDLRLIKDCTKIQFYIFAFPVSRNLNCALIPHGINKLFMLYARQFALRSKRDNNFTVKTFAVGKITLVARVSQIEGKTPFAVQIHPISPLKLRTWILGARLLCK